MTQPDPAAKPEERPLQSPMPRSPSLDQEEPELNTGEPDIPPERQDEAGRRS